MFDLRVNVGATRDGEPMWTQLEITVLVLVGTVLQAWMALADVAVARKEAVAWWEAEAQLLADTPRRQRRATARELRSWRDPDTHHSIVQMKIILVSWVLIATAAFVGLVDALIELA